MLIRNGIKFFLLAIQSIATIMGFPKKLSGFFLAHIFVISIIMSSVPLLIAGDFNIHVDVPGNADSVFFKGAS